MSLGPLEIILIVVVIALIFGARKLPELGKGLGQGIKEYKKEIRDPEPPRVSDLHVTDVQARPLDPAAPRAEAARPVETAAERDHRA